jgi:hypothetical protein
MCSLVQRQSETAIGMESLDPIDQDARLGRTAIFYTFLLK